MTSRRSPRPPARTARRTYRLRAAARGTPCRASRDSPRGRRAARPMFSSSSPSRGRVSVVARFLDHEAQLLDIGYDENAPVLPLDEPFLLEVAQFPHDRLARGSDARG